MAPTIRLAEPGDLDALYDICLRTGDAGADASGVVTDPRLLGHLFVAPYAVLEPDLAFVVGSSRVDLQACKLEYSIVSPK